jgi:MFS family permease
MINTMSSVALALAPLVGGIFLHITDGFTLSSGALRLNNYHILFIISALLFLVPYSMRKKFRVAKEPATSDVIAMLARPRRPIWGTFIFFNSSKSRSSQNSKGNDQSDKNSGGQE